MAETFDVIVVGSGPAGGSAAFFLGEAGKRVLILEKERLPRYKTCGGAISLKVLQQFPFSFEPVIQSKVEALSYAFGEKMVTVPLKDSYLCMVMRDEFDEYLARHAKAEIQEESSVTGVREEAEAVSVTTSDGKEYRAEYLIAADGANSTVARLLNLRRKKVMAGAIEIEAQVPPEVMAQYAHKPLMIFGDVEVGYSWIFPKAGHLSIGVGALNPKTRDLQSALDQLIRRFGIPLEGQPRHGHPVPFYNCQEKISTSRTLLAGDAAGLVDPFTGEGIRFAIKSGRLAAESILNGQPERYSALVDRRIGRNHRLGSTLSRVFYPFTPLLFEIVLRNRTASRGLAQMVDDRIGYGQLLLLLTGTLPFHLLSKKVAVVPPHPATPSSMMRMTP